jgi:S-adenosylmethionine hydrolase
VENGMITGEVIYADHFGNVITNIRVDLINEGGIKYNDVLQVKIGGAGHDMRFVESYGFAEIGEVVCLIGSAGYLEFAVNQGSAEKALNVRGEEKVSIKIREVRPCEDF